ncbi:MAG: hypothetical protein HXX08_07805 [Chloroflexi bacterium]|uniref:Uncharacterized protein n=1 Tax=Candidatus Chlorohelix allophototropha TaxID=3003348 RepID=A0A8T7LUQ3_9CHLR|nr:hypothetical protein [Chloroflexota bacterium]WJW67635.1 hypothetical protein OZ401_000906 [Chloroflexota bacterium L227-S17]
MSSAMWMRVSALLVVIVGITMFANSVLKLEISGGVKTALSVVHLLAAVGLIALFEISIGRKRRATGASSSTLGLVGRILITVALALGLYILIGKALNFVDSGNYKPLIWIHAPIGLIAIGLAEAALGAIGKKTR